MPQNAALAELNPEPSDWLRLQTLVLLRWMAIGGQLVAIAVATRGLDIRLPLGLCFVAVGAAVIANLVLISVYPPNKRLNETESLVALMFDLCQLAFLLFLTGGLSNPFALLILAPVTVSASTLPMKSTLFLGALAVIFVSGLTVVNVPMQIGDRLIEMPPLIGFGFWLSLVIGIVFLGIYSHRVAGEKRAMSDALLATQMALAREQKLTDLGGVVAAAAHELGTPLATIKLVSAELMDELSEFPELAEDARLIREQADRCRDILRSMGKAGKSDLHMRQAPLSAVLREAAEPHLERGKRVQFNLMPLAGGARDEPEILRRPELIHGLRNLVQNAVDFARAQVWVDAAWTGTHLTLRIIDDGDGFAPQVLGRIGDPFLRSRRDEAAGQRPGYEGMGLGLFIAKTLLERTGAEMSFANAADPFLTTEERPERSGAIIEAVWPLERVMAEKGPALGQNPNVS
ncbi:MAG: ActS/PrrB/RegB family redox-sensitive histidine kinase [Pseudorhodobacter sp.]|nr:MAG: ActS/PrrB/RegB family redox-sensitive histidine kinase [Pseudorhodobacter sp.]